MSNYYVNSPSAGIEKVLSEWIDAKTKQEELSKIISNSFPHNVISVVKHGSRFIKVDLGYNGEIDDICDFDCAYEVD